MSHTSSSTGRTHLTPHHPAAHALLSVAQALLCPANALAATFLPSQPKTVQFADPPVQGEPRPRAEPPAPETRPADLSVLPIDEVTMPTDDVSDLRDVFDAINRLCETMRTSAYEDETDAIETETMPERPTSVETLLDFQSGQGNDEAVVDVISEVLGPEVAQTEESLVAELIEELVSPPSGSIQWSDERVVDLVSELVSPPSSSVRSSDAYRADKWSDALVSPPSADEADAFASDTELAMPQEPASEMYYTASSEVSLLSDEVPPAEEAEPPKVIAGHVAAMRERFESMTRANTPCPDLMRSVSPSLDIFRNITPDPDDALA